MNDYLRSLELDPVNREMEVSALREVWIISRCAWTLYNFRLSLILELMTSGVPAIAMGAGGDGFEFKLKESNVSFEPLPVDKRGLNPVADIRLFWNLLQRMRNRRPILVHLFTIKPVIYGGLAARLTRTTAIATITGLGHVFTGGGVLLRMLTEALYRVSLRRMQTVFFQNGEDRNFFVSHRLVRPEQARLIPGSGVDTRRFRPPPEREQALPTFLMLARLIREKGVLEYVEAARRLRLKSPNLRCLLVGAPDPRNPTAISIDVIRQAVEKGNIEWSGPADDVRPWLAQSDVVVLPSYREGLPRSLLEAAAMARAIITCDTVGCRDVVTDGVNGLLVPVRDVEALTNAMLRFVKEPELARRFGRAGRERVLREFDERYVIEKTLAAYERAGVALAGRRNVNETVDLPGI